MSHAPVSENTHPRLREALARNDVGELIAIAAAAALAFDSGDECECDEPDVYGRDTLCGHCLRENRQQREAAVEGGEDA